MTTIFLSDVLGLVGLAKAHLERGAALGGGVADEVERVRTLLQKVPPLQGGFELSRHPVTRHLDAAYKADGLETADLVTALRPVARHLPWTYGYAKRADAPGLERRMGWAEIIGPQAPLRSESLCLGFTLIGPGTLYPAHAHPARELYYVLAGTAEWTAAGAAQINMPGSYILHPSQVVHSMRTAHEPLLALYTWTGGDVKTTSSYSYE